MSGRVPALVLALGLALAASPTIADTITLHPTAQGYSNQGTPVPAGAGTNWDRVNDQTGNTATGTPGANDGNTSYVNMATNAWFDAYALATSNIPSGSVVTQLDVHAVVRNDATNTSAFRLFYRVNSANTLATATSFNSSTWTDRPASFPSLSLAESAWSALQVGITTTDANPDVFVTQLWVVVTYTPPANNTTVGTVTAANGAGPTPSLAVSAPYSGDADLDNSLSYRYRVSPAGAWSGPTNLTHAVSPYAFTVSGLTCGTAYDVEVTYNDPDGVTGTNPQSVTATPTNCTLAGAATANETPGATPSIAVNAPYTRDGDGDNTLAYRYRLSGGAYGGSTPLSHAASPYSFTLSNLTCGASYDVEVTYSDADGVSGSAVQTLSNVTVDNCTTAGSPSAAVNSCTQITVSAPFSFDANANGTTSFEQGPAAGGPWSAVCSGVAGASPRTCVDTTVVASSTYYYRVTYADADGVSGTAQSVIGSYATPSCNTAPTVTITAPSDGASFAQGASVTFTGTATDPEDGNLTSSLSWTSSLNGPIGSGGSFARSDLAAGTHTITATATDGGSLTGQDQVSITITAVVPGVTPGAPAGAVNSCNQITITAPFSGDSNGNSTTLFERSPDGSTGWTAVSSCGTGGAVGGPSPRVCVDTTVADSSVNYYRVDFSDADGVSGTDPQVVGPFDTTPYCGVDGTTVNAPEAEASSCSQITVLARFAGDDNRNGWTRVESSPAGAGTWTSACATLTGASPRQCLIAGLAASSSFDVRIDYTDVDGVANGTGTDPQTLAGISTPACGADAVAPTVLVLSPARGAVVTGTDRVKVQVYDAVGVTSVQWSVDQSGDVGLAAASANANYDCGPSCAVYEFDLATSGLAVGSHYFTVKASDAAGNVARSSHGFRKQSAGGDGLLLRRSRGAQLCVDCHNLKTHSSQSTSGKYGNWAISCDTCHTPHKTRNLYLVREQIETPSSDRRPVRFEVTTGAVASSSAAGAASYANEDNATQADGPCQVCHTRTKNAGGQARWRNSAAGGNADNHYGSAATSRCIGCHTHDAGFSGAGGACDSCHYAPPTVGKHGSHDQVGTLPTDYANTTPTTTAGLYGFACANCHSGTHFSDATTPHTVEVTFAAGGTYAADAGSRATDPGVSGDGWYWSNGTCSNVYCHSDADRLGGITYQPVTWNQAAALTCASCHGDGGASTTLSGAHATHTTATTYNFGCVRCHDATLDSGVNDIAPLAVADKTKHVDGTRTVVFDPSGPNNSGGGYSQEPGYTCSNTYCHSNGQDRTGGDGYASGPSIAWNASAALDCTSCHAGNATAGTKMASGRHAAHVDNLTSGGGVLGVNLECAACHAATVTAGNDRAITGWTNHVDASADVAGTLTDNSYAAPNCDNAYCHSSGQATPEFYSASWTTGTLDCEGCHGRHSTNAFASVAGEPNYTSGAAGSATANSHQKHVTSALDCAKCHDGTTATGTSIEAGSTLHTNQARDVIIAAAFRTAGDGSSNYTPGGATPKSCNNIACHGAGTPQWGATLVCLSCHTGTEGGALGDGAPNAVDDQWATDGHGAAAGGALTSALGGCDYCHQLNAGHTPTDAANPYRLRFSATDNSLCLQCHAPSDAGIQVNSAGTALALEDSALDVGTAHYGTKHQSGEGGQLCWNCHDPHGVPTNIVMIKPAVAKTASAYGVPATSVTVSFTARAVAGDFVKSTGAPRQGVCQACHDPSKPGDPASDPAASTKYWRSDGTDYNASPSAHNASKTCTDCHSHTDNFKGSGGGNDCIGCHGGGQGNLRAITGDFGKQSHHVRVNTGGFGSAVTGVAAGNNADCVVCHSEGQVITSASADCPDAPYTVCTNPTYHANGVINLRDVDSSAPVKDGAGATYSYDKAAVAASAGAAGNWHSGNATWRTQTSTALDPFCLNCHDAGGAAQISTFRLSGETSRTAADPFWDGTTNITNSYDLVNRGAVVDIKSRVTAGASSLDLAGEPRYDQAPVGDSVPDPPQGIYSRHAIRGQSVSVYATQAIPNPRWVQTKVAWNDVSVMGCADCHTTDGANAAAGNAHGSDSEYLLKDATGGASEGTLLGGSYNCYLCHAAASYDHNGGHTGNDQDFQDYTGSTGSVRVTVGNTGGNIYGMACTNCHGGGYETKGDTTPQFGTIHGTSQTMAVGQDGGAGTRKAYRFMNGNSMRFFDPLGWTGTSYACYTLSAGDTFGGCTKHGGKSPGSGNRLQTRNLKY